MQIPLLDLTLHSIQFAAILGDLSHKSDVYLSRQNFNITTTCLFANCEQAGYLLSSAKPLVPPGNWNNHSLGTFFEFFYYSNLTFRFDYLTALPSISCHC
jgi:hypothetical protein